MSGLIEPSASTRQLAHFYREFYVAMTNEGFTESQVLYLINTMVAAAMTNRPSSE